MVTSLELGQSYDCPSANGATLQNMGFPSIQQEVHITTISVTNTRAQKRQCIFEDFGPRSSYIGHGWVITSSGILWDVIMHSCPIYLLLVPLMECTEQIRADSRFVPSQWEMALQSNAISHWLGTNLESALRIILLCFYGYSATKMWVIWTTRGTVST